MTTTNKGLVFLIVTLGGVVVILLLFLLLLLFGLANLSNPLLSLSLGSLAVFGSLLLIVSLKKDYFRIFRNNKFVNELDLMHEEDFIELVCNLLSHQGCKTKLVEEKGSGIEIIASKEGKNYATMAVRSNSPISDKIVVMASEGARKHSCASSIIVTNSSFSEKARGAAQKSGVKLVDLELLKDWANSS